MTIGKELPQQGAMQAEEDQRRRESRTIRVPITWFKVVAQVPQSPATGEDKKAELAFNAMMAEHAFVSSLIPMYRGYQMRAVAFAMTLYGASIGLVGAYKDSAHFARVVMIVAGLLPWLMVILVLAFHVMEIRIRRASRYIAEDLSPRLDLLLNAGSLPFNGRILCWENSPGRYLSKFEKWMSGSQAFVAVFAAPAIAAALWLNWSSRYIAWRSLDVASLLGVGALSFFVWFTSTYSAASESREPPSPIEPRTD